MYVNMSKTDVSVSVLVSVSVVPLLFGTDAKIQKISDVANFAEFFFEEKRTFFVIEKGTRICVPI